MLETRMPIVSGSPVRSGFGVRSFITSGTTCASTITISAVIPNAERQAFQAQRRLEGTEMAILPKADHVSGTGSGVYAMRTVRKNSASSQLKRIAAASPKLNSLKNCPKMPGMKASGISTANSENVEAATALKTSDAPLSTLGISPYPIWR